MSAERNRRKAAVLRRMINRAGLTEAQAAAELGMAQRRIERYLSGTVRVPRVIILALKQVLHQERKRTNKFADEWIASGCNRH